jgi:2-keto-3-deoxy-L-rhamnonate aldolase RhmA
MDLIYIAHRNPHVWAADLAGVDRVMVDLEILGKQERQGHLDTVISGHSLDDVAFVRSILSRSSLMVRVNPIHEGTAAEIDAVLARGAETVMLPMFMSVQEVETFVALINGRARVSLLLETAQALGRAEQILSVGGIDEVHFGLNDLHLALHLGFMFEVLAGGLVDHLAGVCTKRGLKFGFGGIARPGQGLLPAESILVEHARLGSTQVILSRDFRALVDDRPSDAIVGDFTAAVADVRQIYARALTLTPAELARNHDDVVAKTAAIAAARLHKV